MELFTAPDAWNGGTFELTLYLGRATPAERFFAAAEALWSHPSLDGCYLHTEREPAEQPRVTAAEVLAGLTPDEGVSPLRGVATLPNCARIACFSCALMFPRDGDTSDELNFVLPLGSLARAYPIGADPFNDGTPLGWRPLLEDWMADLALRVWGPGQVRLATIGDGSANGDLEPEALLERGVPTERWEAYLAPGPDNRPRLHRANMGAPFSF